MAPQVHYTVDKDGVAIITLDNPPVNALHPAVLRGLFEHAQKAHADPQVKCIVVTGANKNFSAGFDISQFQNKSGGGGIDNNINAAICNQLESGAKPTVAAIQGVALGGGLEVAMGCNARVCASGSRLGLPELQLGIIPGFGGTQRLPRLVGLQKAIEAMLTSTQLNDKNAQKLGLVDDVVPLNQLLETARQLGLAIAAGKKPRIMSLHRTDRLEPLGDALAILEFARAEAAKRARHLTHPQLCLDAIQYGVEHGGLAGLEKEGQCFQAAAQLDTHKALVHIFFAQRSTKKVRGITDAGLKARPIRRVAVLGGGLMGSGIATACVLADIDVLLKEVNDNFLQGGLKRIQANLASRVKKGTMKKEAADAAMARVKGVLDYADFGNVDMVIEAVIEDIPLKQQIFVDVEKACPPHAILSTNTSTIDIDIVGAKTKSQDRIVGAHFFSPAHIMPLLEIVRTSKTSPQVVLDTLEFGSRIKKTPVVVGNCTGFAVNRVFFPYTMAACLLLDIGLNPYQVDKAIASFGMPMGPFRLSDLVGGDVGVHVGKNFLESFPDRTFKASILPLMMEAKRLGEKTGKGFYKYDDKRRASPDPEIASFIEASRKAAGIMKDPKAAGPKMSEQDIVEFIFFPVINEGCRVVDEAIVDKAADLDVASVLAMGFPAFRGGLIFWADLVGAPYICKKLDQLAEQFGPRGGFFRPSEYLRRCATAGVPLSSSAKGAASKL